MELMIMNWTAASAQADSGGVDLGWTVVVFWAVAFALVVVVVYVATWGLRRRVRDLEALITAGAGDEDSPLRGLSEAVNECASRQDELVATVGDALEDVKAQGTRLDATRHTQRESVRTLSRLQDEFSLHSATLSSLMTAFGLDGAPEGHQPAPSTPQPGTVIPGGLAALARGDMTRVMWDPDLDGDDEGRDTV